MNNLFKLIFIVAVVEFVAGCANMYPKVNSEVKQIAAEFNFTEGPAVAPNGDIYFTDIPNNRIYIWSAKGNLLVFRENSGGANGLMFDHCGNLIVCEGGNRRLTSINPKKTVTVLADNFNDKKFNSPNDLWIDPKGGKLKRVINDMIRPNGIIGTPDGKKLYVADHGDKKIFSYYINNDGSLSNKKLFVGKGLDGMALDSKGNLYLTTYDAVLIYNPKGKFLRRIEIHEVPANVCFGKDGKTLFITARTSLYAIRLDIE